VRSVYKIKPNKLQQKQVAPPRRETRRVTTRLSNPSITRARTTRRPLIAILSSTRREATRMMTRERIPPTIVNLSVYKAYEEWAEEDEENIRRPHFPSKKVRQILMAMIISTTSLTMMLMTLVGHFHPLGIVPLIVPVHLTMMTAHSFCQLMMSLLEQLPLQVLVHFLWQVSSSVLQLVRCPVMASLVVSRTMSSGAGAATGEAAAKTLKMATTAERMNEVRILTVGCGGVRKKKKILKWE
jgi:hypothetical protein